MATNGTKKKQNEYSKFGVTKESYEKSKDILPTLDLGKIEVGSDVVLTVLQAEPYEVEHKSKFEKGQMIKTNVLTVYVHQINRMAEGGLLEIPMTDKMTLWLSSKSLALGMLRAFKENGNSLKDVKVKIGISLAEYKDYGENRCYNVTSI